VVGASLSNPFVTGLLPYPNSLVGNGIGAIFPSWKTPMNQMWNANLQRSVTRNLIVEAAYIGSRGIGDGERSANVKRVIVSGDGEELVYDFAVESVGVSASSRITGTFAAICADLVAGGGAPGVWPPDGFWWFHASRVIPTIQPLVKIAPDGTAIHSRAFEAAAVTPLARQGLLAAAKAMAMTTVDLLGDASLLARVKQDFQRVTA